MKVKSDHHNIFSNLSNIGRKKPEKYQGFNAVTSAIPVRCSTNRAVKSHNGSEVNLLSSYLPVQ